MRFSNVLHSAALLLMLICIYIDAEILLPDKNSWQDKGVIIKPGSGGSWDDDLEGAFTVAATAELRGTDIYLYYIGSDGNRKTDGGPSHRALGLAISRDGSTFEKYDKNPILTYCPHCPDGMNHQEEGIWRAVVAHSGNTNEIGASAKTNLYYAPLTTVGSSTVRGDIYLATSANGMNFDYKKKVLDAKDNSLWGNEGKNDEILPFAAFEYKGLWNLFYTTKNLNPQWSLGLATGPAANDFTSSKKILYENEDGGGRFSQGRICRLGENKFALFITRYFSSKTVVKVRTFNPSTPDKLGTPSTIQTFNYRAGACILPDEGRKKWYLFYQNWNDNIGIRLKTAPLKYEGATITASMLQNRTRTSPLTIELQTDKTLRIRCREIIREVAVHSPQGALIGKAHATSGEGAFSLPLPAAGMFIVKAKTASSTIQKSIITAQ